MYSHRIFIEDFHSVRYLTKRKKWKSEKIFCVSGNYAQNKSKK